MKARLVFAILATVALAVMSFASDVPAFTRWTHRVDRAYVGRMNDPSDGYALQLIGPKGWTQCELLKHHTTAIVVRPDLDGTWADAACPSRNGCYCHLFVPDEATAVLYRTLIARYRQGAPPSSPDEVQYRIK